jgi:hypothetical protein
VIKITLRHHVKKCQQLLVITRFLVSHAEFPGGEADGGCGSLLPWLCGRR